MLVSAIVPVKNGSKYIAECLNSLLEQRNIDGIDFEISIFDDGSTDSTREIIENYQKIFNKNGIRCVLGGTKSSGGVGYAKNCAVRQSTGKFILFCDADDIFAPNRVRSQLDALINAPKPYCTLAGSKFKRIPEHSTVLYTKWANSTNPQQIYTQVFTSYGPTLVAPTWCMSRKLYDDACGFSEADNTGYPEDLQFFFDAMKLGADFIRVDEELVIYRYHSCCASLDVSRNAIWRMRIDAFESIVLQKWKLFMIWGAGKLGKRFYKSLSESNRRKVVAFCDVDQRKLKCSLYEEFDPVGRKIVSKIPIIQLSKMKPPVAICLKLETINDESVEKQIKALALVEGIDFYILG